MYFFTCVPNIFFRELDGLYVFDAIALLFNKTSVKAVQPENTLLPMLVTLDGMFTFIRFEQPTNA